MSFSKPHPIWCEFFNVTEWKQSFFVFTSRTITEIDRRTLTERATNDVVHTTFPWTLFDTLKSSYNLFLVKTRTMHVVFVVHYERIIAVKLPLFPGIPVVWPTTYSIHTFFEYEKATCTTGDEADTPSVIVCWKNTSSALFELTARLVEYNVLEETMQIKWQTVVANHNTAYTNVAVCGNMVVIGYNAATSMHAHFCVLSITDGTHMYSVQDTADALLALKPVAIDRMIAVQIRPDHTIVVRGLLLNTSITVTAAPRITANKPFNINDIVPVKYPDYYDVVYDADGFFAWKANSKDFVMRFVRYNNLTLNMGW